MNSLLLAHVAIFLGAAVLCLASIPRALRIEHRGTREGFVGILVTCGLWSGGYVGYFLVPGEALKVGLYTVGLIAAVGCVGAWLYFAAAYTGRSPRQMPYRRSVVGVFLFIVLLKLTNPLHNLYFTTERVSEPFEHLAIHHGLLHWVILGAAYVVIGISFFMLFERFYHAGADARPLIALISITALPIGLNILSITEPALFPIWYEPIGVAIFAVGTLFVYFRRFEIIRLAGASDAPAIFLDQDGSIRDFNNAATRLFPELRDAVGRPIEDVLPSVSAQVESGDGTLAVDHRLGTRYYQLGASPFLSGEVQTGTLLSITDVTEREEYRDRLERQNERLEEFASIVSHDLRNPLQVAEGRLELARDTGDLDELEAVEVAHERMKELIDDLLMLARSGLEIDETEAVDLAEIAQECWEMVDNARARLAVEVDSPVTIRADRERLRQLLENLFRNAIEHGGVDVTITVGTLAEPPGFFVEDDGVGIAEEHRGELFESGFTTKAGGTGFGLAIVEEIVKAHGWSIRVTEGADGGARFEITGCEVDVE
ncbi:MAG: ATP-binding protein [Halobacteriales archaeon]